MAATYEVDTDLIMQEMEETEHILKHLARGFGEFANQVDHGLPPAFGGYLDDAYQTEDILCDMEDISYRLQHYLEWMGDTLDQVIRGDYERAEKYMYDEDFDLIEEETDSDSDSPRRSRKTTPSTNPSSTSPLSTSPLSTSPTTTTPSTIPEDETGLTIEVETTPSSSPYPNSMEGDPRFTSPPTSAPTDPYPNSMEGDPRFTSPPTTAPTNPYPNSMEEDPRYTSPPTTAQTSPAANPYTPDTTPRKTTPQFNVYTLPPTTPSAMEDNPRYTSPPATTPSYYQPSAPSQQPTYTPTYRETEPPYTPTYRETEPPYTPTYRATEPVVTPSNPSSGGGSSSGGAGSTNNDYPGGAADPTNYVRVTTPPTPQTRPVETPVQTPVETPSQTPIETPSQAPVETPSQTPVETPSQTPSFTPGITPIETPDNVNPGYNVSNPTQDYDPTENLPDYTPVPVYDPTLTSDADQTNGDIYDASDSGGGTTSGGNINRLIPIETAVAPTQNSMNILGEGLSSLGNGNLAAAAGLGGIAMPLSGLGIAAAGSALAAGGVAGAGVLATRSRKYTFTPEDWDKLDNDTRNAIVTAMGNVGFSPDDIIKFTSATFEVNITDLDRHIKNVKEAVKEEPMMAEYIYNMYGFTCLDRLNRVNKYILFIMLIIDGSKYDDEINIYNLLNTQLDEEAIDFAYSGMNMNNYMVVPKDIYFNPDETGA